MTLKIPAIVQARMSSQRFPGKMLYEVSGKPLLDYIFDRLKRCLSLDEFIVATSRERSDDALWSHCEKRQVKCFRGDLNNVARRFLDAVTEMEAGAFVRVNGDSPLIDVSIIDQAVQKFRSGSFDLVTNVLERSFPKGQSVEVIRTRTFQNVFPRMEPGDWEHVTTYFYRSPAEFKIHNIKADQNQGEARLCVDTAQDMEAFQRVVSQLKRPHWEYTWKELLEIKERGNARVGRID